MDSLRTLQHCRRPIHLPVDRFPGPCKPSNSLSFRFQLPKLSTSFNSSSPSSSTSFRQTPRRRKPSIPLTLDQFSSLIHKTASVTLSTLIAAAALFFMRIFVKPAIAASNPPATVETENKSTERELEEQLARNPHDIKALRSLMEVRFNAQKFREALRNVNRLIELEPNESKWAVWRGFAYKEMGDYESARREFEKVIDQDPCRFRPYQGLVMLATKSGSADAMEVVLKRVEGALEIVKKRKLKKEVWRLKLLIAQIKFFKGSYSEALEDHQELLREDSMDIWQHFHLGILYMALEKFDEADKQFEICESLAPKHPNKSYFGDDEDM